MCPLTAFRLLTVLAVLQLIFAQAVLDLGRRQPDIGPRTEAIDSVRLRWPDDVYEYTAQLKIGTPGQTMTVRVEFGNYNPHGMIIPSINATGCDNTPDIHAECRFGSFDQKLSSTFHLSSRYSNDQFKDVISFRDAIEFGGVLFPSHNMTLAYDPPRPVSETLRLDYLEPYLPVLNLLSDNLNKIPLCDLMAKGGYIATPAVSMWLQDSDSYAGKLLFSAIDTHRYEGDLVSLEMYQYNSQNIEVYRSRQDESSVTAHILIAMTSLSAGSPTGTDEILSQGALAVSFELGGDLMLPSYLVSQIRNITGAFVRWDQTGHGYSIIPCSMRDSEGYFTFGFGGPDAVQITVRMRSLITRPSRKLQKFFDSLGSDLCRFGINETTSPEMGRISGHLLRSVYTVVDLYNHKVAMAPIKLNTGDDESNIVGFDGHAAPIPSAALAPNQPPSISPIDWSKLPQPTLFRAAEGFKILTTTTTPSSFPSSAPNNDSVTEGFSTDGKIVIGVGVPILVVTIVVLIVLIVWKRGMRQRLATKSPIAYRLPNDELESRGVSVYSPGAQQRHANWGSTPPEELPASRGPSELQDAARLSELPGDCLVPEEGRNRYQGKTSLRRASLLLKYIPS